MSPFSSPLRSSYVQYPSRNADVGSIAFLLKWHGFCFLLLEERIGEGAERRRKEGTLIPKSEGA
jgi:hypothetical protein